MWIFSFVNGVLGAGCVFFLFSRQSGAERKQRSIFTFFRRRLAVTLQGIVCCCWVIRYLENPRANSVITKERITGSINYPSNLAMRVFVCFSDFLRQVVGNQFHGQHPHRPHPSQNDADRQRSGRIQQHRHQQDRQYAESAQLPLRLVRWDKKAGQAPGV